MKTNRSLQRRTGGFVLLEALVGILIFSIGVLGLVGLQASMTKAQTSSKFRGDAAYLASELVGTMWGDTANLSLYSTGSCASNARCKAWSDKVAAALPRGSAAMTVNGSNVSITISWTPPDEETHKYEMATAVAS